MQIKNSAQNYGVIAKTLHWLTMLIFATQYFLVYRKEYFPKDSPEQLQYMLLHKSFGFTFLFIGIFFFIWALLNTKPSYPAYMKKWEQNLAKLTRYILYLIIITMPITGTVMSQASGRVIYWFGHAVPMFMPVNKLVAGIAYNIHTYTGTAAMGIIVLQIIGALKHLITPNDNVVKRML